MGKYVTKYPIFDYYIGKLFYKNGDYCSAKEYLHTYLKCAGEKATRIMLYLGKIYVKSNKINNNLESGDCFVIEFAYLL